MKPAPLPRLTPMPTPRLSDPNALPWRAEVRVTIRDGYACRRCDAPLLADADREIVRVDPERGTDDENLALVCRRCAAEHREHPEPLDAAHEKFERLG